MSAKPLTEAERLELSGHIANIEAIGINKVKLGLEAVASLVDEMNLRPINIPVISVAGTNGKGSTVASLHKLAKLNKLKLASFTSPHLFSFNERISFNESAISDGLLLEAFRAVSRYPQSSELTYFEWSFILALYAFKVSELDLIVLEVGLGGRLDATNVIDATLAIITSIGLDHMDFLGESLEEIGFEKAGVFRANGIVVCAEESPPKSLTQHAKKLKTRFLQQGVNYTLCENSQGWSVQSDRLSYRFSSKPKLKLSNLAAALIAWHELALPFDQATLNKHLTDFSLPFRQQWLKGGKKILLDVAHNEQSISHLLKTLTNLKGKVTLIFSMLENKSMSDCIDLLQSRVDNWHIVPLKGPRARSLSEMKKAFTETSIDQQKLEFHSSLRQAFQRASSQVCGNDVMVICGSFLLISQLAKEVPSLELENNCG